MKEKAWRYLKNKEIIKDDDIIVFSDYETRRAGNFHDGAACGISVIEFLASEHAYRELCGVVTWRIDCVKRLCDKKERVTRKEYKRRVKMAISEIENADKLCIIGYAPRLALDTEKLMKILRGENDE